MFGLILYANNDVKIEQQPHAFLCVFFFLVFLGTVFQERFKDLKLTFNFYLPVSTKSMSISKVCIKHFEFACTTLLHLCNS